MTFLIDWRERLPDTAQEWLRTISAGARTTGLLLFLFFGFWVFRGPWGYVTLLCMALAFALKGALLAMRLFLRVSHRPSRLFGGAEPEPCAFTPANSGVSMDIARYATSNSITSAGVSTDISAFIGAGGGASIVRVASADAQGDDAETRLLARRRNEEKLVTDICAYIRAHFSDPNMNVESVCDAFGRSRSGIFMYFKDVMGCGLLTFINDTRLNEACRLLTTTDMGVQEICQATGFNNQTTFFRAFKKQTEMTPGQYRAARQENAAEA